MSQVTEICSSSRASVLDQRHEIDGLCLSQLRRLHRAALAQRRVRSVELCVT